jgi:toxin ParE1/3/4
VKVRYTKRALRDLQAIEKYIRKHSPGGAARVGARIRQRIDDLALFPDQGAPSKSGARMIVVTQTPYLAIYRVVAQEVQIVTIVHGMRARRS